MDDDSVFFSSFMESHKANFLPFGKKDDRVWLVDGTMVYHLSSRIMGGFNTMIRWIGVFSVTASQLSDLRTGFSFGVDLPMAFRASKWDFSMGF